MSPRQRLSLMLGAAAAIAVGGYLSYRFLVNGGKNPAEFDRLTGNWTSECVQVNDQMLVRVRKTMALAVTGGVRLGERYFTDDACNQLAVFYEADGHMVRGAGAGVNAAQVRFELDNVRITVRDEELRRIFVDENHCGRADWPAGTAVDFGDRFCDLITTDASASYSDFLEIVDGELVVSSGLSFFPHLVGARGPSALLSGRMTLKP